MDLFSNIKSTIIIMDLKLKLVITMLKRPSKISPFILRVEGTTVEIGYINVEETIENKLDLLYYM